MGRMYSVSFKDVAVTAVQDFFEISPADDHPCVIHALYIGQSSDAGDAMAEMLGITIERGNATSGSGGSSYTPSPMAPGLGAAGFTAEVNNTTQASSGTAVRLHADTFNVQVGYVYIPTPETRPSAGQGDVTLTVRLNGNPADSLTMSGTLLVEEL